MRRECSTTQRRKFRKGDLIEETARKALFRGGKRNINDAPHHRINVSSVLVKAKWPAAGGWRPRGRLV
jgi:hypothetical protein